MSAIHRRLLEARKTKVKVGAHEFQVRRPTDAEAMALHRGDSVDMVGVVKQFTVGWNLTELDLIAGGAPDPVAFDAALFADWVEDKPDLWAVLGDAIIEAYKAHAQQRTSAEKNS
jgi:hypothetical protein